MKLGTQPSSFFFQSWFTSKSLLRSLLAITLVLGICFRFVNLDQRVYWGDETYSSLRIAGYKWEDLVSLFDGRELEIAEIQKYQQVTPERGFADMIDSLAIEDPHHPPLYYTIARFWVQWFGDSVAVRRSLSALLSLLVLPCTYWLCIELFNSSTTAWIATAFISVMPFHLLYAQEVREYSLWTAMILFSSLTLLKALKRDKKWNWILYAFTVALGFYTFLMSALVFIAHGVYVLTLEGFHWSKRLISYLLATLAGFILFTPWFLVLVKNFARIQATNADKTERVSPLYLGEMWASIFGRTLFDLQFGYSDPFSLQFSYKQPLTYLLIPTLFLIAYSIYFLCRQTSRNIWSFVLILGGIPFLILILPDLIIGGSVSINARYLIPCLLSLQLAIAYLLASKPFQASSQVWKQKIWKFVFGFVFSGAIISCLIFSQANTWWHKYSDYYTPPIAELVNQSSHPLVILDNPFRLLSLSYSLNPSARIQVVLDPEKLSVIHKKFSDVFIFSGYGRRSQKFRDKFERLQDKKLEPVYQGKLTFKGRKISLWRVQS